MAKSITFVIDADQQKKWGKWLNKHRKSCLYFKHPERAGPIGGRLSYVFTPTTLGTAIKVKCVCNQEIDLSNYEEW